MKRTKIFICMGLFEWRYLLKRGGVSRENHGLYFRIFEIISFIMLRKNLPSIMNFYIDVR